MRSVRTLAVLAGSFLGAMGAQAATIQYLGIDSATGADWRNASVAKPTAFDPNRDGVYGNDGYTVGIYDASNNKTQMSSLPSYVSDTTPIVHNGQYGRTAINDPTNPANSINLAGWFAQGGPNYLYPNWIANPTDPTTRTWDEMTFTLSKDASFVLTLLVPGPASNTFQVAQHGVRSADADSGLHSIALVSDMSPEYMFFNISGKAGDQFTVYGMVGIDQDPRVTGGCDAELFLNGVAFESAVPEPASLSLLGVAGALVLGRRRAGK